MHAVEFTTELSDSRMLPIPQEIADQLPKTGRARIIVLTDELTGMPNGAWALTNSSSAMIRRRTPSTTLAADVRGGFHLSVPFTSGTGSKIVWRCYARPEIRAMKTCLLIALFLCATLDAADLPTVTVEHLYYLQARAERVHKLKPDEMIEYCIAQKIGGSAFESLYSQLFTMRIDLAKLLKVEEVLSTDPRVVTLNKTHEAYTTLLREEVQKVQNGIIREGQVATDTMTAIARAQNPR